MRLSTRQLLLALTVCGITACAGQIAGPGAGSAGPLPVYEPGETFRFADGTEFRVAEIGTERIVWQTAGGNTQTGLRDIFLPPVEGTDVPARIVLMTDGTTTDGRSNDQAVAAAKTAQVPVTTIAFGTDHGTIKLPQEPFPIPVPVDKAALKSISADTGGQFYAAASESQLKQVYDNIGSSVGFVTELREISVWFIAAALVLLLLTGALSLLWFQRLP